MPRPSLQLLKVRELSQGTEDDPWILKGGQAPVVVYEDDGGKQYVCNECP